MKCTLAILFVALLPGFTACGEQPGSPPSIDTPTSTIEKSPPRDEIQTTESARGDVLQQQKKTDAEPIPDDAPDAPRNAVDTSGVEYEPMELPVTRIESGPKQSTAETAIRGNWLPQDVPIEVITTTEHGKDTYVLFHLPGIQLFENALIAKKGATSLAQYRSEKDDFDRTSSYSQSDLDEWIETYRDVPHVQNLELNLVTGQPTRSFGLARMTHEVKEEDMVTTHSWQRTYALLLADAVPAFSDYESKLNALPELRVRDMDGDRKAEVKVVFHAAHQDIEAYKYGNTSTGTQAFIVDEDGHIQIRFDREKYDNVQMQGQMGYDYTKVVWQFKELNGDGHPDLNVVRRRDTQYHMWECGEGVEQPDDVKQQGKDEWQCLYLATEDRWQCPKPNPRKTD